MSPISEYHQALAAKTSKMALEGSNYSSAGVMVPNTQGNRLPTQYIPSSTATARSVSSYFGDEHLNYINYKLSQYQTSEADDRGNKSLVCRVCRCCKKVELKVCTIFKRKHTERHRREASLEPRRNGLEIEAGGRARTEFDIFLGRLHRLFRPEPTQDLEGESQVDLGPGSVESLQVVPEGIVGDSNACRSRRPQVIHKAPTSAHQGVICLEANGLPKH